MLLLERCTAISDPPNIGCTNVDVVASIECGFHILDAMSILKKIQMNIPTDTARNSFEVCKTTIIIMFVAEAKTRPS